MEPLYKMCIPLCAVLIWNFEIGLYKMQLSGGIFSGKKCTNETFQDFFFLLLVVLLYLKRPERIAACSTSFYQALFRGMLGIGVLRGFSKLPLHTNSIPSASLPRLPSH